MLQGMTWASPPAFLMPSATSWQASALRLEITTFAPSLASSSAEERPMPRLEPVMMATFPVRSNGVFFTRCAPSLLAYVRSSWPGLTRPSTTSSAAKTWMPGTSPGMTIFILLQSRDLQRSDQPTLRDAAEVVVGIAEAVFDHGQPLEV